MSTHSETTCSVLVPVLNEARFIEPMVATLRGQQLDGTLEFLFACADSSDGTTEILRRLAHEDDRIHLLDNPRGTIPAGLNIALKAARGTWVARMDAHSVYPASYLALGIARLKAGGTTWVSGPQRAVGHNGVSGAVALALQSRFARGTSRRWASGAAEPRELELDTGVFGGVWSRETLLSYRGWDERWQKNEDSELAARFLRGGERLVSLAAMAADYTPRDSFPELWRQYVEYGRFRAKTARRHPHSLRRSNLLPPALITAAALATVPGRAGRPARAVCGLYAGALVAAGFTAGRRSSSWSDAALVPVAIGIMHGAHGVGLIRGAFDDRPADEVFAPSLGG